MRAIAKIRRTGAVVLLAGAALVMFAAGCGDDDFENEPRPPVTEELTGVIQADKVTVSPDGSGRMKLKAGPFLITISNQDDRAHTVILEGVDDSRVREQVGPIDPLDTAQIQKTLPEGEYEVGAGSEVAQENEIEPAQLLIEGQRKSSNDELLLP